MRSPLQFVDWFNAVDTTYQNQLRDLNDLNWERFKAFSRADMAEFRQSVDRSISALRAEMEAGFAAMRGEYRDSITSLRVEMEVGFASMRTGHRDSFASVRIEMSMLRADMMKWMFIYWTGSIITLGGLMFALLEMQR